MEETLKAIRMQHQLLMLLCIAVTLFALIPDQTIAYRHAIWEIHKLRSLGLRSYALAASKSSADEDKILATELRSRLHLPGEPAFYRVLYCDWPGDKASVNDYLAFLNTEQSVAFFSVGPDDVVKLYTIAMRRYIKDYGNKPRQLTYVRFYLDPHASPQLQLDDKNLVTLLLNPGLKVNDPRLTLNEKIDASDSSYEMHVDFDFPVNKHDEIAIAYEEITSLSTTTTIPFHPNKWLEVANDGKPLSLIGLRSLANQVGTLTLADASQAIQAKIDAGNREITFGGVSVDSRLLSWVAPLATWLLLLYLLLHLSHLRAISSTDKTMLGSFPWVGLFPSLGARLFAASSLAIFPSIAIYLLFRRYNLHGALSSIAIGTILATGVLCCLYLFQHISTARGCETPIWPSCL